MNRFYCPLFQGIGHFHFGHFIPSAAIEYAACFLFIRTTPLFEEKRHTRSKTLVSNIRYPFRGHWSGVVTTFTADNYPIDPFQIQFWQWTKQGFTRQEFNICLGLAERINPVEDILIFNGDT